MNLLTKAYNSIKQTIDYALFLRKFNSWYESKEIHWNEQIQIVNSRLIDLLANGDFDGVLRNYTYIKTCRNELNDLIACKEFVLKNLKNNNGN